MKMIKRVIALCLVMVISLCFVGCQQKGGSTDGKIYYIRTDKAGIGFIDYDFRSGDTDGKISEALSMLAQSPENIDFMNAIPAGVTVKSWELNEGNVNLYFVGDYDSLEIYTEILVRAAIVKTLVQIKGVKSVSFYVNDAPLTDSNDNGIGPMTAETFIEDFGQETDSLLSTNLTLYFASADGVSVVPETRQVYYSRNVSIDKLVMDQLLKGPKTEGLLSAIPTGTKLNSISISENGVCIVNFDGTFETAITGVTENATIYSIVNSLTELDNVKQVQILVNGETPRISNVDTDLSDAIKRNEDIINLNVIYDLEEDEDEDDLYLQEYEEEGVVPEE